MSDHHYPHHYTVSRGEEDEEGFARWYACCACRTMSPHIPAGVEVGATFTAGDNCPVGLRGALGATQGALQAALEQIATLQVSADLVLAYLRRRAGYSADQLATEIEAGEHLKPEAPKMTREEAFAARLCT